MKKLLLTFILFLIGVDSSYAMRSRDFSTLDDCVASIRIASKHELEVIIDNPNKVSGFLKGTNKLWACVREESGTKGIYYNGYYDDE